MTKGICQISAAWMLVTVLLTSGLSAARMDISSSLQNDISEVSFQNGVLCTFSVNNNQLLKSEAVLSVQLAGKEPVEIGPNLGSYNVDQKDNNVSLKAEGIASNLDVKVDWILTEDLECRVELTNKGDERLEAFVALSLPLHGSPLVVRPYGGDAEGTIDFSENRIFGFRTATPEDFKYTGGKGTIVMPAVSFYETEKDYGLTVLGDFSMPTRGFELRVDSAADALIARRVFLRLEKDNPVTVSIILVPHKGDWRPGLGRIIERYPTYFETDNPRVPLLHGGFRNNCETLLKPRIIKGWKDQHVKAVEIHCTIPFYGKHLPFPGEDEWTKLCDDTWHWMKLRPIKYCPGRPEQGDSWQEIREFVTRYYPPNMSVKKINDYIDLLHSHDMFGLMYFNPTETWNSWVVDTYPEALCKNGAGKYINTWLECHPICPDPATRYGKKLIDEFTRMLEVYPESDGYFMDQSCYDFLDYAHDDGISIQNGRTAYRMGLAICNISAELKKIAKKHNKFMWWNGPYNIDIASMADGMMSEAGNEKQIRSIHYLTAGGRPCCTLSRTKPIAFKNCVKYGIYPTYMATPELREMAKRYWPIFDLFKGKRWILNAHALKLPDETEGNIYRIENDNVLVTAVTTEEGKRYDKESIVKVNIADAGEIREIYFISPELDGRKKLDFVKRWNTLNIDVPAFGEVFAILLVKENMNSAAIEGHTKELFSSLKDKEIADCGCRNGTETVEGNWN